MDTTDRPNANLPARLPPSSARQPAQLVLGPRDIELGTPRSPVNSRQLLRGLVRNWWRILLLWLVVSLPLAYLIFWLVEPTYQAYSLLRIESNSPDLFGASLLARDAGGSTPSYLQTQITSITNDPVLDRALAESTISKLPMIKDSTDPKADLRKKLEIQVIPNTHWMRVALESTDPKEATEIVNAIVDAFGEITKSFGTGSTKLLKTDLENYKKKLKEDIEKEQTKLRDFAKKGNVVELADSGKSAFPKATDRAQGDEADHGGTARLQQPHARPVQDDQGSALADRVPARGARIAISIEASRVATGSGPIGPGRLNSREPRSREHATAGADRRGVQAATRMSPP